MSPPEIVRSRLLGTSLNVQCTVVHAAFLRRGDEIEHLAFGLTREAIKRGILGAGGFRSEKTKSTAVPLASLCQTNRKIPQLSSSAGDERFVIIHENVTGLSRPRWPDRKAAVSWRDRAAFWRTFASSKN